MQDLSGFYGYFCKTGKFTQFTTQCVLEFPAGIIGSCSSIFLTKAAAVATSVQVQPVEM